MPSSPTPPRRRRSSSAGSPRTMHRPKADRPRSSACCKACRRVPRPWKGRLMANHDDLDLIHLFGLSAEEASGLGLDLSAQSEAEDGRRKPEERARHFRLPTPASRPGGEPVPPAGTPGLVAHAPDGSPAAAHAPGAGRTLTSDAVSDELALLAMLECSQTR